MIGVVISVFICIVDSKDFKRNIEIIVVIRRKRLLLM